MSTKTENNVVKGKIPLWPPSKSNSRRPTRNGLWIKSDKALMWSTNARWLLKKHNKAFLGKVPVKLTATVYYDSWRPDLDVELLCDALQEAGVIENDRQIVEKHYYRRLDRRNPRTEFTLERIFLDRDSYVKS